MYNLSYHTEITPKGKVIAMDSIILYLINIIQEQYKQICYLLLFICKYIPLKQWTFDDARSPKYQKFKVDAPPIVIKYEKYDYKELISYFHKRYGKLIKPIRVRKDSRRNVPANTVCPRCGAPHDYLYDNNGGKGQYQCSICSCTFKTGEQHTKPITFKCPHCGNTLEVIKERKAFKIHKCKSKKCPYYLARQKVLPKDLTQGEKHEYKLHYIYREFTIDFFRMDLYSLPKNATTFNFKKFNPHILGLVLTYHVNLKLSTRQTAHALEEVHGIKISHTTVANYAMTAAAVIKPFVDSYDYKPSNILSADETYIKKLGVKHYVWFIMDACKKSIIGYQVSDTRSVGPCILAMRMAFEKFKEFPGKALKFIADGYSAYPLAAQQCKERMGWDFDVTQVIGLTNDDAVSTEWRWVKQVVERMNRTFKASYRSTNGYNSDNGALYGVSLWVAYYNFLRPHPYNYWKPLNELSEFNKADNMPAKWQILIKLGQEKIYQMQQEQSA